jgi:exonuclease SbcC
MQDVAAAILARLQVGDPCPVCGEPITELSPHVAPDLAAADAAVANARRTQVKAQTAHQAANIDAAAAHARAESVRTSFATIEAKLARLDEELAAASVTRANVDRSAKRASTAAAAERERSAAAHQQAEAAAHAAGVLRALLVKLPQDLECGPAEAATIVDDIEALAATLGAALEEHACASDGSKAATAAVQEAEALISSAATEVKTAIALQGLQASAVTEAHATLLALGAPADASLGALRTELEALDAVAARAAALQAQLAQAQQQHAAATAVLAERTATCETSARAVLDAKAAAAAAVATAEKARAAFEDEWRRQLPPELGPDVTAVPELMSEASRVGHELAATLGHARATLEAARTDVARAEQLRSDASTYRRNSEVASDLGLELQANRFVAFIQREAMQALATDAGGRMLQLSRDRYRLEADGDEFVVVDRLNGDERRSVRTLSGGETFLASLALALALSERLPELSGRGGALSLESLFLDEGFGSLDAESLSVAIEGLELLATGSRMIGIISHVPEVAERLPERIEVVKTGGASTVRDGR